MGRYTEGAKRLGPLGGVVQLGLYHSTVRPDLTPLTQSARIVMNRTVVIVKTPHKRREYGLITLHWNYGQPVEDWIRAEYGSWHRAYDLLCQGHRSTIEKPHREPGNLPEHMTFTRLKDARAWCEHLTLAYHNGKRWRFEHVDT